MLLRRSPQDMGLLPDGRSKPDEEPEKDMPVKPNLSVSWSLGEAVRTSAFWFFFAIWFFLPIAIQVVYVHLFPYASDVGIAPAVAATILSVLGVSQVFGSFVIGGIADKLGSRPAFLLCLILFAATLFSLILARELWVFYLITVVLGIAFAGTQPAYLKIVTGIFGPVAMGAILGILNIAWTVGKSIAPTLAGYIFDTTGTYTLAFVVAGAAAIATLLLFFFVPTPRRRPISPS